MWSKKNRMTRGWGARGQAQTKGKHSSPSPAAAACRWCCLPTYLAQVHLPELYISTWSLGSGRLCPAVRACLRFRFVRVGAVLATRRPILIHPHPDRSGEARRPWTLSPCPRLHCVGHAWPCTPGDAGHAKFGGRRRPCLAIPFPIAILPKHGAGAVRPLDNHLVHLLPDGESST